MYLRSRRVPMIMTSTITTACCGVTGVCGKSIENGVDIFVHFFTTPTSILNLTMSSESQANDVSNDILSERKYSQLFKHDVEYISVKTVISVYGRRAPMTPQSIYRLLTDGRKENKASHDISLVHSVHLADIMILT